MSGKWYLSGRGHVLKLLHDDNEIEVYSIKEFNGSDLILNIDIGMEIKGIAKLHLKQPGFFSHFKIKLNLCIGK